MDPKIQDILSANVVFVGVHLINEPTGFDKFREAVGSEVVVEGGIVTSLQGAVSEPGNLLRLAKDRILLECTSLRSSVKRDYPEHSDLDRLAIVANFAVNSTNIEKQKPRAFGFNIELVYDQSSAETALTYLASRIFSPTLTAGDDWQLNGGIGSLIFAKNSSRMTAKFEPRFSDVNTTKVFFSLNYHVSEPRVPKLDEIQELLCESWEEAKEFINRIHRNA